MNVLVTGGTGYIGSHTVVELLAAGHEPVIVDNLRNSKQAVLDRLRQITGRDIPFHEVDITDAAALDAVAASQDFDAVIHFAGLKAVGESVKEPLTYYHNNLDATMAVIAVARKRSIGQVIFSSSATVYGAPDAVPIPETAAIRAANPYGQTKVMSEQMLRDAAEAYGLHVTLLRYFNPIGAHSSGLIGEDPQGVPNNLVPFVAQVAVGKHDKVKIYGDDWPTPDGTGVRDYIHVVDLARGHVAALAHPPADVATYNLGTGRGSSVREVIAAFEAACGKSIPVEVTARRPGDIAACYADVSKAGRELDWHAQYDLATMCRDAWSWQSKNPNGLSS